MKERCVSPVCGAVREREEMQAHIYTPSCCLFACSQSCKQAYQEHKEAEVQRHSLAEHFQAREALQ